MRLSIIGVKTDAPELLQFHKEWKVATARENVLLNLDPSGRLSALQEFTIDLFCGFIADPLPEVLSSDRPAQIEMEALQRGRQLALAAAFSRGHTSATTPAEAQQ